MLVPISRLPSHACTDRTSIQLSLLINKHWVSWAGPPKELITDSAGEFCSEEFSKYLQSMDTKGHTVAAEAHWQLGRCERHGAILQTMLDKYQQDQPISSDDEFEMALQHCCAAKNSLSRYRGYSPEILVLGKSRHVPASNMNEEPGPADMLADQTLDLPESSQTLEVIKMFLTKPPTERKCPCCLHQDRS